MAKEKKRRQNEMCAMVDLRQKTVRVEMWRRFKTAVLMEQRRELC